MRLSFKMHYPAISKKIASVLAIFSIIPWFTLCKRTFFKYPMQDISQNTRYRLIPSMASLFTYPLLYIPNYFVSIVTSPISLQAYALWLYRADAVCYEQDTFPIKFTIATVKRHRGGKRVPLSDTSGSKERRHRKATYAVPLCRPMDTSRYICSSTRCPVSGTNLYVHLEGPWRYGDFICPKPRSDLLNSCLLSSVMLHTEKEQNESFE